MTDILCRWLNEEVKVVHKLSDANFAEQFSSGYLIGEVLSKYGLQEDFPQFSKARSSEAKLNNFLRLEPTFRLLEVPFNINLARDVMNERTGAAMRLLYQLFVALNRMKKQELNGLSLEFIRSPGKMKLEKVETSIFQERLKHQTPRQADLNFEELVEKFKDRQRLYEEAVMQERQSQSDRMRQEKREICLKSVERAREAREKYTKLKPISPPTTMTPQNKESTDKKRSSEGRRRNKQLTAESEETRVNIDSFEAHMNTMPSSGSPPKPLGTTGTTGLRSTGEYLQRIRRRTQDLQAGREEREKRRRRVLVQQMNALHEQEEERRKQQLVERLMRQCQQESRITTQLMHIRREKDTIRNNRIYRQKQFEEQRMREYMEEIKRNETLTKLAEKERLASETYHLELYHQHKAKAAELNYHKNYQLAASIVDQILDFSTKTAEYRELTEKMVPAKLVHDWKTLLIAGQPLYQEEEEDEEGEEKESMHSQSTCTNPSTDDIMKDVLLDETDFWQYRNMEVDWKVEDKEDTAQPYCPILTHIVYSLLDMVDPPQPPPSPPHFPKFLLRASLIGKPFTGKTTVLTQLNRQLGVVILVPSQLVEIAVQQYFTEKSSLETQLATSQDEESPIISEDTDDKKEEESGNIDEENPIVKEESGNIDEENPIVKEESGNINEENPIVKEESPLTAVENETESDNLPPYYSELSTMGRLGCKAYDYLCKGEPVVDHITVAIITETLRSLPEMSSWILDNYPITLEQAKLLSTSLTGEASSKLQFSREFVLLPEHQMKNMELQAAAGLDLILHLNATSETVLSRAAHHQNTDQGTKLSQIQHRLLSFEAGWPRLRRWLQKFRILTSLNTHQEIGAVVCAAHDRVKDIVNKSKQHEALLKIGVTRSSLRLSCGSTTSLPTLKKLPSSPQPKKLPTSPQPPSKPHPLENKISKRKRRPSSAGAPPLLHVIQQAEKMVAVKEKEGIEPGEEGWDFCCLPINSEMAECLAGKWSEIERIYLSSLKTAFRHLRKEREIICRYFYKRKGEFMEYLDRPDHKQELVSQWQNNFNSLTQHLRREDSVKAEFHCKAEDLCDSLWDICDKRKEEWEQERERISSERWLEDHLGLITNTYLTIMQAEMVKFQETLLLLQDYYNSMAESVPAKLSSHTRLPLIELVSTEAQEPPSSSTDLSPDPPITSTSSSKKSMKVPLLPRQPPGPTEDKTGGGKKKEKGSTDGHFPPPVLEDTSGLELDQQLVVHAYNTAITSIHNMVVPQLKSLDSSVGKTKTLLKKPAPSSAQATGGPPVEEEKVAGGGGKAGKGGKEKGGKGTPGKKGGKKGGAPPEPPPPPQHTETVAPSLSAEERAKKEELIRGWREHKTALQYQEVSVVERLKLIKSKAVEVVAYLKSVAVKMNEDMEKWMGNRYKDEVECVTQLSGILRQAVEDELPLLKEIMVSGKSFFIEGSCLLLDEAPPLTPPTPLEAPPPGAFSVVQLMKLHRQLQSVAPDGIMLAQTFVDTIHGLTENTCGDFIVPDTWCGMTKKHVQRLCDELYGKEADYIDWRHCLVCVAQPWPLPSSSSLLDTLWLFRDISKEKEVVNKDQFMAVKTWMDLEEIGGGGEGGGGGGGEGEGEERGYNRNAKLKEFFFQLFEKDRKVNYVNMLLYLSVDARPELGLAKALTTVIGEEIRLHEGDVCDRQVMIRLTDLHKVLNCGQSNTQSNASDCAIISEEAIGEVFDRVGRGERVEEVELKELLLDPVAVDWMDSLTFYTLPDVQTVTTSRE